MARGIESAAALRSELVAMDFSRAGELVVSVFEEFLACLRELVVEEFERHEELVGYVSAFDEAASLEMSYLRGLPVEMKAELAVGLHVRGLLSEVIAFNTLFTSPAGDDDEKKKEKKKKAAGVLKKELEDILPDFGIPGWLEKVIDSILSLL